jgi:hypothetical protein
MKYFIAIFTAITFASAACSAEPAKKEEPKKAEVKKVCVDKVTKDGKPVMDKDGKQAQDCKEMKVHQKLEGTKVPDKK